MACATKEEVNAVKAHSVLSIFITSLLPNLVFLHQSAVSVAGGDNLLKIHGSWEGMLKQEQNKQLMAAWRR